MEVCQRLTVTQPSGFGHETFDEAQQPVGAIAEQLQQFTRLHAIVGLAFIEPALGPRGILRGWHPDKGQIIGTLEMGAFFGELRGALALDQGRGRIGEVAFRIVLRCPADRFDKDRPARSQTAQRAVETGRGRNELGRGRAVEIGPPEAGRALKAAVLVEHHAGRDQRRPGQEVGEAVSLVPVFAK